MSRFFFWEWMNRITVSQPMLWRDDMNKIMVRCPNCLVEREIEGVLTAQSNQNVIYECLDCGYVVKDIKTSKG
jgi:DNA-directed RNA polymerase subunit RPC12/RpoP